MLDALARPSSANCAAQVANHDRLLDQLPAPFAHDGTDHVDKARFRRHAAGKFHQVWQGLQALFRSAPYSSQGAKPLAAEMWRPVRVAELLALTVDGPNELFG